MTQPWQKALIESSISLDDLLVKLQLSPKQLSLPTEKIPFKLRVTQSFIDRMQPGNPKDPLLLQILPQHQEQLDVPGYNKNPLQETEKSPVPGLLHKYHDRVLMLVVGGCAVNCRYCFRRHFPYHSFLPNTKDWPAIIDYIQQNPHIREVILSGGDPLIVKDDHLKKLVATLEAIPHLRRLRIHSRLPVVLPERINEDLLHWMKSSRLQIIVVIHCNHPQEINPSVIQALTQLRQAGVVLLNQAVLLKGINDDATTLVQLSDVLFDQHVHFYYLHKLDPVAGAAHFYVSKESALQLIQTMQGMTAGYLVPKLAQEIIGASSKTTLA